MPHSNDKAVKRVPISKQTVEYLKDAPLPRPEIVSEVRTGKPQKLENERSAFWKQARQGPVQLTPTGLVEDEHVVPVHGGIHRAVHQYSSINYPFWRREQPNRAHFFNNGAFGENITAKELHEENVCVGDVFAVGDNVRLEVTEPRIPCYKLNMRFQNPRMLSSVFNSGKTGWMFRVLKAGFIMSGDEMRLLERPNPKWSILNVERVVHGKHVKTELLEELVSVSTLSPQYHHAATRRLQQASRTYVLESAEMVSKRVRQLTFTLKDPANIRKPEFPPFAFAQIKFGPEDGRISRSYSIVSGDLQRFTLGIALDDDSRGGSRYMHEAIRVGEEIQMSPGRNPNDEEQEKQCKNEDIRQNIVIIGGIGVTAFLPTIRKWENDSTPFEIHYAVRSHEDAAFVDQLPGEHTTVYVKSRNERLNVNNIIPSIGENGEHHTRLFICGPERLMTACESHARALNYPEHLIHTESFGSVAGNFGDAFEVEVQDANDDDNNNNNGPRTLTVPSDKSLLQVMQDAGFDVMSNCEVGLCGTCKVTLCGGEVVRHGKALAEADKERCILSCVDRGKSKIKVEIE